jgi:plasmid stabilization system protein ParE
LRVAWTEEALRRLAEIEDYVARDRPIAARRLVARLIRRGDSLSRTPRIGRRVPELLDSGFREIIAGAYRIVYRLDESQVEILTAFESRLPMERALSTIRADPNSGSGNGST